MIPQDPVILLSFINTRLRDFYQNLDALCEDLRVSRTVLEEKLKGIGYQYEPKQNQFR